MTKLSVYIVRPYIIRYLEQAYVDAFFEKGELVLSSFSHLKSSVNSSRRDTSEGVISYTFSDYRVVGDISNRYLVLCTSLSTNERARCRKNSGIVINDVNQFCGYIQCALEDIGIPVKATYHGPCNYYGRDQTFKQADINYKDGLLERLKSSLCLEDMLFSKDPEFDFECEYRLVFKLGISLSSETDQVKVYLDGKVKSLCRKILF